MRTFLAIAKTGFVDGFRQPWDLTSGITYTDKNDNWITWKNELYDHAANVGQWFGKIFNRKSKPGK